MTETVAYWLVEFVGATPCPIYATNHSWPTCNPWDAEAFKTQDDAETWMKRPGVIPFGSPWEAVSHGFELPPPL